MSPNMRLRLCTLMILLSTIYAVLVVKNPQIASAVALGYVGLLLTGFMLNSFWKKP